MLSDGTHAAPLRRVHWRPGFLTDAAHGLVLAGSLCALLMACHPERPAPSPPPYTQAQISGFFDALVVRLLGPNEPALAVDASEAPAARATTLQVRVSGTAPGRVVHLLSGASAEAKDAIVGDDGIARFRELDEGHYQVWASAPGKASALVSVSFGDSSASASRPLALELLPATILHLGIRDDAGKGLAARLTLIPLGHEHTPIFAESAADGSLVLPSVPRGNWRVQVSAKTHTLPASSLLSATDAEQSLNLELVKNASVAGRVLSASDEVVADALVRITRLDAGESQEALLPSGAGPRWVHPLPGKRQMPLRDSRRFGAARDGLRPMECGGGHCGVDLGGKRGWPVMAAADGIIVVSSRDDRGKAGRYVAIEHSGGFRSFYMHLDAIAESIEPGLKIRAGTQLGSLGRSGIQRSEPHLHFALSKQDGEQSYFVDPETMLSFAVLLAMPQESAATADLLLADQVSTVSTPSAGAGGALRTDARGQFALTDLAPGSYLVHVVHPELAPGHSERFTLEPGQTLGDLEIRLALGHKVLGRVLGVRGKAPGGWVRAYQGEGESRQVVARALTDSDGFFELRPLLGDLELEAGAPGFGVESKKVHLGPESPDEIDFDLFAFDSALRGQVVGPNGDGIAGAELQVLDGPGARGRRILCDSDGFFRLESVPDGRYKLRVRSQRFPDLETTIDANQMQDVTLVQGGPLRVTLLDAHSGRALAALRVQALGRWKLTVSSPDYTRLTAQIDVRTGEQESSIHELKLARGATVAGILRDANGDRVAGARIFLGDVATESDEDGRFRLDQVSPGQVLLGATLGEAKGDMPLTLFAGDEYLTLELRLRASED